MKKLILILLFLLPHLGVGGCYAQADFTRIYHPIINEAELAIVDTNYYDALDFYKEAFANVQNPFGKDYYNAAICAAMVGKMPLVFDYLEKIVEKGYPSDSLRKDVFFHYVADTCKRWNDFEKQMKLVKPTINWEVRDSLKKLYALKIEIPFTPPTPELKDFFHQNIKKGQKLNDSLLVFMALMADSAYSTKKFTENLRKQQDSLRNINQEKSNANFDLAYTKTLQLISSSGFPDETMIGLSGFDTRISKIYRNSYGTERNFNKLIFTNSLIINILANFLDKKNDIDILPILIQAIREGKVFPAQMIMTNPQKFNPETKKIVNIPAAYSMGRVQVFQFRLDANVKCENPLLQGKGDKKFWKKEQLGEYSEAEINEKRTNIGLEKLADAYKKAFFKANSTPFIINGGTYQTEISYVSSCEVLEKMLKESVLIK